LCPKLVDHYKDPNVNARAETQNSYRTISSLIYSNNAE
jgi:hypothetical protein